MEHETAALCARRDALLEQVAAAAKRSGRRAADITLLAVSKYQPAQAVAALAACGQTHFSENYIQEALEKMEELHEYELNWHFTGHLQSNKARFAVGRFSLVHTVDSFKLAQALHKRASAQGMRQAVLLQVNIGDETQKAGVAPEALPELAENVAGLSGIEVRGLMCLPPWLEDPEAVRPSFARLRRLQEDVERRMGMALPELSMGMSHDFEQAVEEGATIVRIGTALFGPRPASR
ncbi:MAG: YggS family pyridoxal phosphate-dependent enzyme [Desulfovibrionaceae bacterium]